MRKIVGFAGPAGSGKDTCGKFLVDNYGYERLSFATPMYKALDAMGFGWPKTQAEKEAVIPWLGRSWRYLAQTLGTEWGRNLVHQNLWAMLAMRPVAENPDKQFVFTDVRFENEAAMIREMGGVVIHLIGRKDPNTPMHASEVGIAMTDLDMTFYNGLDGNEGLKLFVEDYLT